MRRIAAALPADAPPERRERIAAAAALGLDAERAQRAVLFAELRERPAEFTGTWQVTLEMEADTVTYFFRTRAVASRLIRLAEKSRVKEGVVAGQPWWISAEADSTANAVLLGRLAFGFDGVAAMSVESLPSALPKRAFAKRLPTALLWVTTDSALLADGTVVRGVPALLAGPEQLPKGPASRLLRGVRDVAKAYGGAVQQAPLDGGGEKPSLDRVSLGVLRRSPAGELDLRVFLTEKMAMRATRISLDAIAESDDDAAAEKEDGAGKESVSEEGKAADTPAAPPPAPLGEPGAAAM
ncbi:MAG: hypothetical protein NW201_09155 [Gemmatimonadales bacterium]|nr:hypothetical protein [Gemmatimonadales bacterium]